MVGGFLIGFLIAYGFFFLLMNPSGAVERPMVEPERLQAFLTLDTTNFLMLENCLDYAITLREKGANLGIRVVIVNMKKGGEEAGHALNSALLTNGTVVFIEPQNDYINVDLEAVIEKSFGKDYRITLWREMP